MPASPRRRDKHGECCSPTVSAADPRDAQQLAGSQHVAARFCSSRSLHKVITAQQPTPTAKGSGSDVALQSADVALISDRLERLPEAIGLARRAMSIMRVNVIASPIIKGLFVLLAPFGLVTLVLAIAADTGMSLLVTHNALRLLHARHPTPDATTTPARCAGGLPRRLLRP